MQALPIVSWALVLAGSVMPVAAQVGVAERSMPPGSAREGEVPRATLRVDSSTVLVPVSVADAMNRPVTGLEKQHFRVFDGDVEQTLTVFSMEDAPIAVGLVFDTSGSMADKLHMARRAAAEFFKTANPEDEFFLVEFNNGPKVAAPLTRDVEEISNRLAFTQAKGRTALLDAIVLSLHELKKSTASSTALLIISDGGDNASRYNENEVRELVRESDALIYAIGVYGGAASPEELAGPALLEEIAEQTGGRLFTAAPSELADIAGKIGLELRNRYILGFSAADSRHDGKYHSLQVKLEPPKGVPRLKATWRRGYYAPGQ